MMARFTLHGFWRSGPCYKVALAMSLMGLPYDYVNINLRAGEHKTPAFLKISRYGQVPCLEDTSNGRSLTQAAVMLEYLSDVSNQFGGSTLEERLQIREWLFWDYDRLSVALYRSRSIKHGFRSHAQPIAEMYYTEALASLQVLDAHLKGRTWMVGEGATLADINLYGVVYYAPEAGFKLSYFPAIQAWMNHVEALKGYAKPTDLMPLENRKAA
jgi:glutathione S-transferase